MLILHRMAFPLSDNMVTLHLDNRTAKAYYIIKIVQHLFLSRLVCHILNMVDKHGITCIIAYIPIHVICGSQLPIAGKVGSGMASSSSHSSKGIFNFGVRQI